MSTTNEGPEVRHQRRVAAKALAQLYPMDVHVPFLEEMVGDKPMYVCIKCGGIMPYHFYKSPCRGWTRVTLRDEDS